MTLINDAHCFFPVSELVKQHGRFRGAVIALMEKGQILDWAGYNAAANRVANALIANGVEKGDRVGLLCTNGIWTLSLIMGIWRARAVVVPLSTMLTADICTVLAKDAGIKRLFCSSSLSSLATEVAAECSIPVVEEGDDFDQFVAAASDVALDLKLESNDIASIIYSSGTTGVPKGITHTQGARLNFARCFAMELNFTGRSRSFSAVPPYSNGAWLSWMPAFVVGAPTFLMPKFDVDDFLAMVKSYRPTHGFIVPTMCAAILEHPEAESAGLENFECALTAGAPMPAEMKQQMRHLTGNGLWELWGLTESIAAVISPEEMAERPDSVGRPVVGMDIRIIDEQDNDITFVGIGEIVGRSDQLMEGYWGRANDDLYWQSPDGKSYLRTGDIGEFDKDGYLSIRGRSKDMIISGGINIYPVDIEAVLLKCDGVKDATVFGVDHPRWGETPIASVILEEGAQVDLDELKETVNSQLAHHQRISELTLCETDFPRNLLGKVLKNQLQDEYESNQ